MGVLPILGWGSYTVNMLRQTRYDRRRIFWLLALTVAFRSLVVPGLTPVADADSPLRFSIAFCDELYQPAIIFSEGPAGAVHPPDHEHGISDDHDHSLPIPGQCDISILGGIFIETPSFSLTRYLQPPDRSLAVEYANAYATTTPYPKQLSRAPPRLFAA